MHPSISHKIIDNPVMLLNLVFLSFWSSHLLVRLGIWVSQYAPERPTRSIADLTSHTFQLTVAEPAGPFLGAQEAPSVLMDNSGLAVKACCARSMVCWTT